MLLNTVLACTVMAGSLLAAGPAHAKEVCTTAPNGARVCYDDDSGGQTPGSFTVPGEGKTTKSPRPRYSRALPRSTTRPL